MTEHCLQQAFEHGMPLVDSFHHPIPLRNDCETPREVGWWMDE